MIFQTVFMYIIISSVCLIYGIGIKELLEAPGEITKIGLSYIKILLTVIITMLLIWIPVRFVFIQYNFEIVFPLITLIFLVSLSALLQHLWPNMFQTNSRDITLSFFSVFLAVSEGITLIESLILGFVTVSAFYLLLFLMYCVNRKNSSVVISPRFNTTALMLITLACLILALYGWNVSWLRDRFF